MEQIPVFLGFDLREAVAFHVCCQSILDTARYPDQIQFHAVTGDRRDGSNAFTFARFEVPYRCGFKGWAIFLDGDMIVRSDIAELWEMRQAYVGVCVVKHHYQTKHPTKYTGAPNLNYERKNWGSVALWNCSYFPNRVLTPDYIARADAMFLRQFRWLKDEQIGELPAEWNRLVLEDELTPDDKLRHFTIGSPCFSEYADCDGSDEWHQTLKRAMAPL